MPENQDSQTPELPLGRLATVGFKAVSGTAALVTAITTIYASLFSPNTDLLQFLGFAAATLAAFSLGLALFVAQRTRRVPLTMGEGFKVRPAFKEEERKSARIQLLPLGTLLALCAVGLFAAEHFLTPRISDIHLSDTDGEVLVISGSRFGSDVSRVWVRFTGVTTEEQIVRKAERNVAEVIVPPKFTKGTISIRRGPRASTPVSFTFPGVIYETAIVELVQPREDPIQRMLAQFEPYPGFPYYSEVSDKPTQWPPRVFKDRSEFDQKIRQVLSGTAASELRRWQERTPASLTVIGGSDADAQLALNQSYARLRMLLTQNGGNYNKVAEIVGPNCARALKSLEDARRAMLSELPNRVFIFRVRNRSPEDAENFNTELKVGGAVYDVTVNEEGEKAKSLQWSPDRINVDLSRLRPGYTTDIRVWYSYLPVAQRVFADAADLQWEKTEGVVVENLVISNGQIRPSGALLTDLHPYHRYPVDPVVGSPTFGPLPEPPSHAANLASSPQASPAAAIDGSESKAAPVGSAAQPPVAAATIPQVVPPGSSRGQAIIVVINVVKDYERQNDAREAQIRITKEIEDFSKSLTKAVQSAGGYWVYRRATPTNAEFSKFSGTYFVKGGVLGILRAERNIEVSSLAGWTDLRSSGLTEAVSVPWDTAAFKVVLHFFSDSRDSKEDSKRVLTQPLTMDRVFDLQEAKAGQANRMAPQFADLLKFARARLVAHYHAPFTLNDVTETERPFYIVLRQEPINENFYLPDSWMAVAEENAARKVPDRALSAELWALFDYAQNSRELTSEEFSAIFGSP